MVEIGDIVYIETDYHKRYAIIVQVFDSYSEVDFIGEQGNLTQGTIPNNCIKKIWKNPQTVSKMYEHIGKMFFEHCSVKEETK